MYARLTIIDESTRPDHYYLDETDECWYLGEYTARKGYGYSETNQLIFNLKKSVSEQGTIAYKYKLEAFDRVARDLHRIITDPRDITFVPVPPSKAKTDPEYDDRLVQVLERFKGYSNAVDYRELISQTVSTKAAHEENDPRLSSEDLQAIYALDEQKARDVRNMLVVFDDVLTTGGHFKAMKSILGRRFPGKAIYGLFIARRDPEAMDMDDFQ